MKFCFYFCIPTINGEIFGEPFILTSLSSKFSERTDLTIYRCVINGLDSYVKEL